MAWLVIGCQAKVAVETKVARDGTGTVSVGLGLDAKARARAGDLDIEVKLDDLAPAGWTVTKAANEADGFTWLRATKPFRSAEEFEGVMGELVAPNGMFSGFKLTKTETDNDITYHVTGSLDGSKGIAQFGDLELQAKLNNIPFGGLIPRIEAAEGRPVADMVSFDVTVALADGPAKTFHPTLRDTAAISVDVVDVEAKPPPMVQSLGAFFVGVSVLVLVLLIIVMLVGVRRRFTHVPTDARRP